jgi:hypothetical protein
VEVTTPDGQKQPILPQQMADETMGTFQATQKPGDYWVRVSAGKDGRPLGPDAVTRFIVDERDLELDNPAADRALLDEISTLTGGYSMPPEQLGSFLNRMLEEGFAHLDVTQVTRLSLWDNWYFLATFVALMSVEWLLRKIRGLV